LRVDLIKYQKDLSQVSEIDFARLAMAIDAEGSICIGKRDRISRASERRDGSEKVFRSYTLYVSVCNTDPRLVNWCKERFGGSVRFLKPGPKRLNKKILLQWIIASVMAEDVLINCLPFFIIKKEKADLALAFRRTFIRGSALVGTGHVIRPEVLQEREEIRNNLLNLPDNVVEIKEVA